MTKVTFNDVLEVEKRLISQEGKTFCGFSYSQMVNNFKYKPWN